MEYVQEITLDLNAKSAPPIVYAKQGDADTRVLEVHIMEDGNEYQPEPGTFALYRVLKPDGTYIGNSGGGEIAGLSNNIVYIRLSEQALAAAGRALVDVLLYNGNQYLSTMSFILNIQSAPTQVMRGVVSTNEFAVFSDLMSSLGEALGSVASYATRAETAASAAASSASNFSLTAGTPMDPGEDPTISGTAPSYTVRLPSIKPMAKISIDETGIAASATVKVENFEGTAPTGLDPNLIKVFDFEITLPAGRNVQIDNTLTQPGQAADAAAAGNLIRGKYTKPSNGIPLSDLESSYIIPIENGGTGSSDVAGALANLGAQPRIKFSKITVASGSAWSSVPEVINSYYDTPVYWQKIDVANSTAATPTFNITSTSQFIATPYTLFGWNEARECGLYPPQVYASEPDKIIFAADAKPSGIINIHLYCW